MAIPGKRTRRTRLVRTERYVVAVDVEVVFPEDDPEEACYEAKTVAHLRDVEARAARGDVEWLAQRGKVYAAVDVA